MHFHIVFLAIRLEGPEEEKAGFEPAVFIIQVAPPRRAATAPQIYTAMAEGFFCPI